MAKSYARIENSVERQCFRGAGVGGFRRFFSTPVLLNRKDTVVR